MTLRAPPNTTIRRDSIADQIYRSLRRDILRGAFEDGERLVQHAVALRMGTSRIPVRDALKRLESDGLLVKDANGGYYCKRFEAKDLEEIYALRAMLEPYAVRLAIPRLSHEDHQDLAELVHAMDEAIDDGDAEAYLDLNREFHMSIYEACDQGRLVQIIKSLWLGRPLLIAGDLGHTKSANEHHAILAAVRERRSSDAEQLMRDHVLGSLDVLRVRLAERTAS